MEESLGNIPKNLVSRDELLSRIERLRPAVGHTALLAIDGRGASGKSSLAEAIFKKLPNVTVIHTDDFAINSGWDWLRMRQQLLEPILHDQPGHYQRFDWNTKRLEEWHEVPVGGVLVVEGVSSTRRELGDIWDLSVWVDCPQDERLKRALERDGKEMMPTWIDVWEVREDQYVNDQMPDQRADLIIDGNAAL